MSNIEIIDPRVASALIGALVVAGGWFVSGLGRRGEVRRRRREQRDDLQTALMAEIGHYRDALEFFDLDEAWENVVLRMESSKTYTPFIPSERNDTIFRAMIAEINILPAPVIQPVTRYYNQVFAIEALIEDMRSDMYAHMDQPERIALFTDYIALKKEALIAANDAIEALNSSLGTAMQPRRRPSSPGAGPSDR